MSVNTTTLRRRITKFESEGHHVTHIGLGTGYGPGLVKKFRDGRGLREATLEKMDKFLRDKGY